MELFTFASRAEPAPVETYKNNLTALTRLIRQIDAEGGSFPRSTRARDGSAMVFNYPLTDGQAHTRIRKFLLAVQALKDLEDPVEVFSIKADAVILHTELIVKGHRPGGSYGRWQLAVGLTHIPN